MARDERLSPAADSLTEDMGAMLHKAGFLSPGEARAWIESTKDDLAELDDEDEDENDSGGD